MSQQKNNVIIIMGVSGVGKTTIGKLLAEATGLPFYDGDDYHSSANIAKMAAGNALTDIDRQEWLEKLHELLQTQLTIKGCILACSALKEKYRQVLERNLPNVNFVYLKGSYQEVLKRLEGRKGHYMKADLLQSQFDILEEPTNALTINIQLSVEDIVATIVKQFSL
jgi:carbohydrate kinase (thermoresistant glucokinase family)